MILPILAEKVGKLQTQMYQNEIRIHIYDYYLIKNDEPTIGKLWLQSLCILFRIEFGGKMSESMDTIMGECIEIVLLTEKSLKIECMGKCIRIVHMWQEFPIILFILNFM